MVYYEQALEIISPNNDGYIHLLKKMIEVCEIKGEIEAAEEYRKKILIAQEQYKKVNY